MSDTPEPGGAPRRRIVRHWAPTLAATAALIYASLRPVEPAAPAFLQADKLLHMAAYAVLALLLAHALARTTRLRPADVALAAIVWASALGALLEQVQHYVGRSCDFLDVVANVAGATLAVLLRVLLLRRRGRPSEPTTAD